MINLEDFILCFYSYGCQIFILKASRKKNGLFFVNFLL